MARRVLWAVLRPLFRFSPRPLWGWRRLLLRVQGATIGDRVHIYPDAKIILPWLLEAGDHTAIGSKVYVYNLGIVRIGRSVTISQDAYLCGGSHESDDPEMRLLRVGLEVEDYAWIAAGAFIGPGVTVGEGALVGARAVAIKDVPSWTIVAGNPARAVKPRKLSGGETALPR